MVAPLNVDKFIRDKTNSHSAELYEAISKDIQEFVSVVNISLEDFAKGYTVELGPTTLVPSHGGVVGMDLDLRPDTSTVRFVTHYRIRRKTDQEREAELNDGE